MVVVSAGNTVRPIGLGLACQFKIPSSGMDETWTCFRMGEYQDSFGSWFLWNIYSHGLGDAEVGKGSLTPGV